MQEKYLHLYVNDRQLCELLGVGNDKGRAIIKALLPHGFPEKDPIFKMYYFPAVKAFLDLRNGIIEQQPMSALDGEESWNE
ncbi:winged helix-turn-helix domain-containing protein [Cohaesibacter intestini]|uniref:winged helix-turn-helix domain-containing protein n=1 Tax=Cohaesibacter intestini TaxID=2211145 RepID=UPI000DE92375|nr:winged helix-turn-helix domain-containing protein [Cohaesibacter intestini]